MSKKMAIFFMLVLANGISLYSSEAVRAIAEADALARQRYARKCAEMKAQEAKLMLKKDTLALEQEKLERELAWLNAAQAISIPGADQKQRPVTQ